MNKYILYVLGFMFILLVACQSGPTPSEQIYVHFEKAVMLEAEFENQQDPIVELEQKEKELYDQIIELGQKEMDQIKQLSQEALLVVAERKSRLEKEYESIKQSKAEFDKTIELVDEIKEEQSKELANEVLEIINNRYQKYEEIYTIYSSSILLDTELYNMFQQEDLELEKLEEQIAEINKSYESVIAVNQEFNDITTEYNEKKKLFYDASEIAVTYKQE